MPRLRVSVLLAVAAAALCVSVGNGQVSSDRSRAGNTRFILDDDPSASNPLDALQGKTRRSRTLPSGYGRPPGYGAGTGGFVSNNPPRTPKSVTGKPFPIVSQANGPSTANTTQPTGVPSARAFGPRPGAALEPLRPAVNTVLRRRPKPEEDPFDPIGIRAGGFIVKPAVEVMGGYNTNPGATKPAKGSTFVIIAPEMLIRSDWSRHELSAILRGSYTAFGSTQSLDRPYLDARANGRLDITSNTRADFESRFLVGTDSPNSPDLPAGLARLPIFTTLGGTAGLAQRFNRFELAFKASFDRVTYEDSELTNGMRASNQDRNYNQYAALLRASYELTPGMKPFAEVAFDTRIRDLPVDNFGVQRDSEGTIGRVGTTFEFSRKLTGELSVGYLVRTYKDPTLPDLSGMIADGSLIWAATGLTTVKLVARSSADESTLPGVAGVLRRDFGAQLDHAFRRWLIATARVGYGEDKYEGLDREDKRYLAALAITYKMNRSMHLKGELRHEWLRSNSSGNDYDATIAMAGVRLQR